MLKDYDAPSRYWHHGIRGLVLRLRVRGTTSRALRTDGAPRGPRERRSRARVRVDFAASELTLLGPAAGGPRGDFW